MDHASETFPVFVHLSVKGHCTVLIFKGLTSRKQNKKKNSASQTEETDALKIYSAVQMRKKNQNVICNYHLNC